MNAGAIPAVLGESSFQAFLHPPGIGNCFVFEEDGASDVDDVRWLSEKRQKACTSLRSSSTTRMALFTSATPRRYSFRNGQDRLDALACSFSANCVVSRTRVGTSPTLLTLRPRINSRCGGKAATARPTIEALADRKGRLRQATWRGGEYYESSHVRTDPVDRLIAIAIGFESLFSPSDQGDLNFRTRRPLPAPKPAVAVSEIFPRRVNAFSQICRCARISRLAFSGFRWRSAASILAWCSCAFCLMPGNS